MGDEKDILEQSNQQMELSIKDMECQIKTQETLAESIKSSHDLEASSLSQINEDHIAQIARLEVEANAMSEDKAILE